MPIGGGLFGAIGSGIGGLIGEGAANQASQQAQQAAQQGNSLLQQIEQQSQNNLQPFVGTGQEASGALAGLLGIGGNAAQSQQAFQDYLGSTNYNFVKNQGEQGIEYANAPAFSSSATAKALDSYNTGLAGNALAGYEGQLSGLAGQGIGAAGTLGGLGNQNAGAQASNLMGAAGISGSADLYGAGAEAGALRGFTSGLSSFGTQGGFGNVFGGGGGGGGMDSGYSTNNLSGSLSDYLAGL